MPSKILLLDDNTQFSEELRNCLKSKNYQLFVCSNSSDAIDIALVEKPNIFICDWQLKKDINGLIVTEIINSICSELKVLFISGYNSYDLRENLKNFNNLFFLEKPFSKKKLLEYLEKLESLELVQETHFTPAAIFDLTANNSFFARNRFANSIKLPENILEKINSKEWQYLKLDNNNYAIRIRNVGQRKFIILIDVRNEMLIKDPRFTYFLTGRDDPPNLQNKNNCMLVIDEHEAIRSLASEIMLENKIFCHTAISIDEGLEILNKDQSIGTVIVDSNFDKEVINDLITTAKGRNKQIRIIGACASLAPNMTELKFDELLNKPFSAQALIDLFKRSESYAS